MTTRWIKKKLTGDERLAWWADYLYECPDCSHRWTYGETKYCPECGNLMEVNDAQ